MEKLAHKLLKDPRQPTAEIDPIFAKEIVPQLRSLYSDVKCEGREDKRYFEKPYDIKMIPIKLQSEDVEIGSNSNHENSSVNIMKTTDKPSSSISNDNSSIQKEKSDNPTTSGSLDIKASKNIIDPDNIKLGESSIQKTLQMIEE